MSSPRVWYQTSSCRHFSFLCVLNPPNIASMHPSPIISFCHHSFLLNTRTPIIWKSFLLCFPFLGILNPQPLILLCVPNPWSLTAQYCNNASPWGDHPPSHFALTPFCANPLRADTYQFLSFSGILSPFFCVVDPLYSSPDIAIVPPLSFCWHFFLFAIHLHNSLYPMYINFVQ